MRAWRRLLAALSALVLVAEVVGSAAPALASGPVLSAVVPPSLAAGAPVTFTGSGFGESAGTVRFAPSSGTVTSVQATYWSPTQVQATVPDGMAPGVVASSVATAVGLTSNALPLTVTSATYAVVTSGLLLYYSPADANGSGQPGSGLSPATLSDLTPSRDDGTLQGFAGTRSGMCPESWTATRRASAAAP